MKKKSIYILLTCFLFVACQNEESENLPGNSPVEVNARISDLSRVSLGDNEFDDGDSFTLYEGTPNSNNNSKSEYKYDGSWSGNPGLFWDNLEVWDSENKGNLISDATLFTAVLGDPTLSASDAPNKDKASFTVTTNQNVTEEKEYLKNDILVAYGSAKVSESTKRKLSLKFSHIFARLNIKIKEADSEGTLDILSKETTVTLVGIKTKSIITFDDDETKTDAADKVTRVEADDNFKENIILRNCGSKDRTFSYEAIIPAQSLGLEGITLSISNNENGKIYTYDLFTADIKIEDGATGKDDLLQQGHLTTLSLNIQKSKTTITATLTDWTKTSSTGIGTPTDYPIIEIGDESGGDDGSGGLKEDDYAGKTIQLTSDIDAKDLKGLPFGSRKTPFRGTFDGRGFTIKNVKLTNDKLVNGDGNPLNDLDFLGVFGYTDGATIKNLNIQVVEITNVSKNSSTATGGLAGYINNTLIENCHVILDKEDINSKKTITASYNNVGGLVGYVNGVSIIRYCSANANVKTSQDYVGGLIGQSQSKMSLTQCFAKGTVEAGENGNTTGYYAGGLIGYSLEGDITFSYSWASVKAARYSGGLIGRANSTIISNCYAAGEKVEGANAAGLIGYSNIAVSSCYWNVSCNANTKGVIGISLDSSCSSFTLTQTKAAMGTVLNGLNLKDNALTENWELTEATDYNSYILPTLFNNWGDAKPKPIE